MSLPSARKGQKGKITTDTWTSQTPSDLDGTIRQDMNIKPGRWVTSTRGFYRTQQRRSESEERSQQDG